MTKKYMHFYRTDQNTPQTKHRKKIWLREKRITIEPFLQILVHQDMKSTKETFF